MATSDPELSVDQDPPVVEERNWAELPRDVLLVIFQKVQAIEVILSAQYVCRPWRQISHEPQLWRCIDMTVNYWDYYDTHDLEKMGREAIDRSAGQLEEFYMEYFGNDEILLYMANSTSRLRCLRLVSCYSVSDNALIETARKFPLLEELDITFFSFSDEMLEPVSRLCSQLKCFRMNSKGFKSPHMEIDDDAFTIANNMPELRQLQLFGNKLTNKGLMAILDKCPHLESLDLRQCFNVKIEGDLQTRCARIRDLRRPYDSTHDYGFSCEIEDDEPYGDEYEYEDSDYDPDLIYDDFDHDFSDGSDDYSDFLFLSNF